MLSLLQAAYYFPFGIGAIIGITAQRVWCHQRARWLNRHHPLPDGSEYVVSPLSRTWVAGLITTAMLGYVLVNVQHTHDQTIDLAKRVEKCQVEATKAVAVRDNIKFQNDKLSKRSRELLTDLDDANGVWTRQLVTPPPNIAALQSNDPARQTWTITVTLDYLNGTAHTHAELRSIYAQEDALFAQEEAHPLPPLGCDR